MAIDPGSVGAASRPSVVGWTSDQCLLYALGVGAGMDDASSDLPFTTENSEATDQRVLPTFPVVLASPSVGEALAGIGPFDHAMLVHGEQEVELHGPLPIEGRVTVRSAVTGIWDKGSGALVETETSGHAADGGTPLFTLRASLFIRGEGGFGGSRGPSPGAAIAERAGPSGRLPDPAGSGAPLPPERGPQSPSLRPEVRGPGRLRASNPPRAVHLRVQRSRLAGSAVRR